MIKTPESRYARGYGFVIVVGLFAVIWHAFFGIDEFSRRGQTIVLSPLQQLLLYPLFGSMALLGASGLIALKRETNFAVTMFKLSQYTFYLALIPALALFFLNAQ